MAQDNFDALAILAALFCTLVIYHLNGKLSSVPLPPGPRKFPIVGNLFNAPRTHPYITYRNWGKEYGMFLLAISIHRGKLKCLLDSDILHLVVAGSEIIVLNSVTAATDLLEKRSSNYSSRYVKISSGALPPYC